MKIYVLGSTSFMVKMIKVRDDLVSLGIDGWLHKDYDDYVNGTAKELTIHANPKKGEKAQLKRDKNYFNVHYKNILASDAVLVVNEEKHDIKNYIGGNALIEMGQAYVNRKKIFLLNDLPTKVPYSDEIEAMDPICLKGSLSNINKYL